MEHKDKVTIHGNPLTLIGKELKKGEKAPNFTALNNELKPVSLSDFEGKIKVISTTPSLDTPVCDTQLRNFNKELASISDKVVVINLSMDLPFAIGRFCSTAGIESVITLSDHKDASFGEAYGLLIKELRLLARSVIVLDGNNTVKYNELVPEVTSEVNSDAVLNAVKELL